MFLIIKAPFHQLIALIICLCMHIEGLSDALHNSISSSSSAVLFTCRLVRLPHRLVAFVFIHAYIYDESILLSSTTLLTCTSSCIARAYHAVIVTSRICMLSGDSQEGRSYIKQRSNIILFTYSAIGRQQHV